jgi:ubiquinone/menaquinone biosynthesis C-methylase UbiE
MIDSKNYKITRSTYRRFGKNYIKAIQDIRNHELNVFTAYLPKNAKILDIGCAGGRDSKIFCEKGFNVIGIDIEGIFIKEAKKRVSGVKFVKMDARSLTFPDNYFDGVWANAVLLHFSRGEAAKIIKSINRVLVKKGKLFLKIKWGKGCGFEHDAMFGGEKRYFTYYNKTAIEKMLKLADFKIISSQLVKDLIGRKNIKWISIFAEK